METRTLKILDPSGLHARPAARFVQVASRFTARIVIRHGDRQADAKSLIALLGLTLRPESVISLEADGADETAALAALTEELAPFAAAAPVAPIAPVAPTPLEP